jgi:hypothetical protein
MIRSRDIISAFLYIGIFKNIHICKTA